MNKQNGVRFQVLTAENMKMAVFWFVVLCRLLEVYGRFRGALCLVALIMEAANSSQTSVHGATTHKTAFFMEEKTRNYNGQIRT
jgi:hypothetical protein